MEHHHRDLIARLFVTATEFAEAAHEIAIAGQSPSLAKHRMISLAAALRSRAGDLAVIADAIAAIVGADFEPKQGRRQGRRPADKRPRRNAQSHR
jgi:hypothetical protein